MGRRALVGFLVVFAVFGLWRAAPWAAQERERIAGSPSLGGFYSANPVVVPRGEAACVAPVPLSPDVAKVSVSVIAKTPQPLELTLRGPGYSADADLPADYPTGGETPVTFLLDERPPGELMGELCVANAGEREVSFAGTEEPRSVVVAGTTVAGKPRPDMAVTLYGGSRSRLRRLRVVARRSRSGAHGRPAPWLPRVAAARRVRDRRARGGHRRAHAQLRSIASAPWPAARSSPASPARTAPTSPSSCSSKGYDVHGMVRRASTEKFDRIEHLRDRITLHQGDLLDQRSLVDALRASKPGRDLQPRRDVLRRGLVDPADAHRRVHRRRRHAHPRGDARGLPRGALLPGIELGDVRQGPRGPADRVDAVLPALALRRGEGLRALHHRQLPRVLRPARDVAGSSSTTNPSVAGWSS